MNLKVQFLRLVIANRTVQERSSCTAKRNQCDKLLSVKTKAGQSSDAVSYVNPDLQHLTELPLPHVRVSEAVVVAMSADALCSSCGAAAMAGQSENAWNNKSHHSCNLNLCLVLLGACLSLQGDDNATCMFSPTCDGGAGVALVKCPLHASTSRHDFTLSVSQRVLPHTLNPSPFCIQSACNP